LERVLAHLGVPAERVPGQLCVQARFEVLLLELAQAHDARRLAALAKAAALLAPEQTALVRRLEDLAATTERHAWPEEVEEVWLSLGRIEGGYRIDLRLGPLGYATTLEGKGTASAPLGAHAELRMSASPAGMAARLVGRVDSPLVAMRARVWSGLKALTKTLLPLDDDRLGPERSRDDLVLLDVALSEDAPTQMEDGGT
jgi:hypothetical protein